MLFAFSTSGALAVALFHGKDVLSLPERGPLQVETHLNLLWLVLLGAGMVALCRVAGRAAATWAVEPLAEITHQLFALRTAPLASRIVETSTANDLHELVQAINARLDCAQAEVQRERRVVDDLAHELRTALTAQILVGELMLSRAATTPVQPARAQQAVCDMLDEARHMEQLITGLLALARLRTGRKSVQLRPVDVGHVAQSCVHMLQVLAEEKSQSLQLIGQGRFIAHADPTMLRQSLLSILHNAIDHCHCGAVIRVRINDRAGHALGVEVCIEDNGPGIPVEQQPKIFERFACGEGGCRTGRGLGLGLAIAKAMTEAQGGSIRVDSAVGQGTRFSLGFRAARNACTSSQQPMTLRPNASVSRDVWNQANIL